MMDSKENKCFSAHPELVHERQRSKPKMLWSLKNCKAEAGKKHSQKFTGAKLYDDPPMSWWLQNALVRTVTPLPRPNVVAAGCG